MVGHRILLLGSCAFVLATSGWSDRAGAEEQPNTAVVPDTRYDDPWWREKQDAINNRVKQGGVDLIFLGDSITQAWENYGKEPWDKYFAPRNAVNMGIGGDKTQHLLWRLDHGNVDGIKPKLAVLMIGTNNGNNGKDTGAGIQAVVKKLREKLPTTRVLILAIVPRGLKTDDEREKSGTASKIASELADNKDIYFLDVNSRFLKPDGDPHADLYLPDLIHLSQRGYEIWAEAINPKITELMEDKK